TRAVTEKVIRVYPVADLVIPIPNSFNQSQVQNSLSIFGTAPGLGLNVGGPQALGGFQFGGGLGGGLGALGGALGGGLGALGGFNPAPGGAGQNQPGDEQDDVLPPEPLNALGYYPPARAVVVKGTSRIHSNIGGGLLNAKGGGGMGAANRPDREDDGKVALFI